jgi:hypothetical protein
VSISSVRLNSATVSSEDGVEIRDAALAAEIDVIEIGSIGLEMLLREASERRGALVVEDMLKGLCSCCVGDEEGLAVWRLRVGVEEKHVFVELLRRH